MESYTMTTLTSMTKEHLNYIVMLKSIEVTIELQVSLITY